IPQHATQLEERPRALRDGDGEHRLATRAELRALGHIAQAIEVDVGAGRDGHRGTWQQLSEPHLALEPSYGQRPSWLQERSRVLEGVLDRRADLVAAHRHRAVEVLPTQVERVPPHLPHGNTVSEDPYLVQGDPL